jgi:Domain of unknown function (DUF4387)
MTDRAGSTRPLAALAKTIRSKNAGVDKVTFDVIFEDRAAYELVRRSGVLSRGAICALYGIPDSRISDHVEFDPGLAIKFTLYRTAPSGSVGDPDIFGSQQYGPLLTVEVPVD